MLLRRFKTLSITTKAFFLLTIVRSSGSEKGKTMTQSVFEQTDEQITDTIHKASRAASAAVDAIEDGVGAARRAAKRGGYAAAELYDDAKRRVQQSPTEAIVATFAAGIIAGTAASWLIRKKCSCNSANTPKEVE
jgi:hypothetical protein